ncbi:ABC transporter substrate-binding protein [Oricola sp.]|uniref:ABC transporter substrate-binding protein n=1 Tax=Oricola sp. TaxID=1979950 RepID=UPI0025FB674B|nr:ABC transporter substrate-binding protein [Oricola sp.]MCI5075357.1 ABC transporter substrate-binding protein [Oricola sp.]
MLKRHAKRLATALAIPLALTAGGAAALADGYDGALGTPEQEAKFQALYEAALGAGQTRVIAYGPPPAKVVLDTFHARFPKIEVIYQQLQSAERLAKLEQEKQTGNFVADIASDGRTPVVSMAVDGWCQQREHIMDVPEAWSGVNGTVQFQQVAVFGLAVNTNLLAIEDAPKSWRELTSEQWKGKVVMVSPAAGGAAAYTFAQMDHPDENDRKYDGIKEGIKENISLVARDALVLQEVAAGNYPIGALAYYPYFVQIKAQGAPIEFVFPFTEGGGNMWTKSAQCLIQNAPNPIAADLYMNWEFSKEGQQTLSDSGLYPVMPGTPGPGGLPPLDTVDLMEQLPDEQAIKAYGPYVREVIAFFGG